VTPGEAYCAGTLVRVVCSGDRQFVAGLILHPETQRAIVAAPILRHLLGQPADKLRAGFKRLGYRATIVRRGAAP
jgi:hypothetical protein